MKIEKIKFSMLSIPLKTTIVMLWVILGLYLIAFITGFVIGVLSG